MFNLRRMNASSLVSETLIRELLYADDADLVAHSPADMQEIMDRFADACTKFGLTISLVKTKVVHTPAPGDPYVEPDIYVYGSKLEVVRSFVYLGSLLADAALLIARSRRESQRLPLRLDASENGSRLTRI